MSTITSRVTGNTGIKPLPDILQRTLPVGGIVAGILLVLSMFLPYWHMTLDAPQYPGGLAIQLYVNKTTGDVSEIDGLNHYIGMRKLDTAGQLERAIAGYAIPVLALLAIASALVINRWLTLLLALPAMAYPLIFIGDLFYWLYTAGHSLDPKAPLSSSIKPFTPAIWGLGKVGQFRTHAHFEIGFYLAIMATVILVGIVALRFWNSRKLRM
ncbi:MAG: cytochrome C [Chloroflexi bacterium]|nr:cytochrome C [Chloroflexota bacterium]